MLLSTSRDTSKPGNKWGAVVPTGVPDLGSNLNTGTLSDGRVFLVWNGVPRPHVNDSAVCGAHNLSSLSSTFHYHCQTYS